MIYKSAAAVPFRIYRPIRSKNVKRCKYARAGAKKTWRNWRNNHTATTLKNHLADAENFRCRHSSVKRKQNFCDAFLTRARKSACFEINAQGIVMAYLIGTD
jgi:hypothetical protein